MTDSLGQLMVTNASEPQGGDEWRASDVLGALPILLAQVLMPKLPPRRSSSSGRLSADMKQQPHGAAYMKNGVWLNEDGHLLSNKNIILDIMS